MLENNDARGMQCSPGMMVVSRRHPRSTGVARLRPALGSGVEIGIAVRGRLEGAALRRLDPGRVGVGELREDEDVVRA